MESLKSLIESRRFEYAITTLIVINAITLGLETSPSLMARYGNVLGLIDSAILGIFVLELLALAAVYRAAFIRDPWLIFDLVVVTIAAIAMIEAAMVVMTVAIATIEGNLRLIVRQLRSLQGCLQLLKAVMQPRQIHETFIATSGKLRSLPMA